MALYGDEVPYNRYFDSGDEYPSLVSVLERQGYESTAFHPYLSSGWNRTQVYRAMGFDNIVFEDNLDKTLDTMRIYTSDEDYRMLIYNHTADRENRLEIFYQYRK